jgi:putative phage-type endonuclease
MDEQQKPKKQPFSFSASPFVTVDAPAAAAAPPDKPKRKAPMRVGVENKPKEDPVHRVRHEALCDPCVLDRLLLLWPSLRVDSAAVDDALRVASATLGRRVLASELEARRARVSPWQAKLRELLLAPGVPQRTPEWYKARETMVTASDIAQALGCAKFGTQRTFFQKKCGAPDEQSPFNATLPPLKWGVMYEPVAQAVYSAANLGVKVHEFGLLRHPTLPFVGASPDGITELGVMLEIKCPWRRKIVEGELPSQYYYQIQGQLAVCGLEECDYFECEFVEPEGGPDDAAWSSALERGASGAILAIGLYAGPTVRRMVDLLCPEAVPTVTKGILDVGVEWGIAQAKKLLLAAKPRVKAFTSETLAGLVSGEFAVALA